MPLCCGCYKEAKYYCPHCGAGYCKTFAEAMLICDSCVPQTSLKRGVYEEEDDKIRRIIREELNNAGTGRTTKKPKE